jgi:CHAT domain-containing protein
VLILSNGAELEEALAFYKNSIKFRKEDKESYTTYWKPFEPFLAGIKKVYFSADGVFTQINPSTLYNTTSQRYVVEQYQIAFLTNAKDLLQSKTTTTLAGKAVLVGNPNYQIQGVSDNRNLLDLDNQDSFWLRNSVFASLPATQTEIENIEKNLQSIKNLQIRKLLGKEATEANLKTELNQVQLLHIATHGFFIPSKFDDESKSRVILLDTKEIEDDPQDDPMLRSGLVFAGVTDYFRNEKRNPNDEDGILTAYEVMNLKLDNTALVVLSACETGLGKVQAGEGVFGLQRAFKIAGTQSLVMSLWKVDDSATQELMQSFYEEWVKSGNKVQAFVKAQNKLKEKYKHPYYWGAFVLIGE